MRLLEPTTMAKVCGYSIKSCKNGFMRQVIRNNKEPYFTKSREKKTYRYYTVKDFRSFE